MSKKRNYNQDISTNSDADVSILREAAVQYSTKRPKMVALIGTAHRPEHKLTSMEKMELAKEGVEKRELENLKAVADLDYDNLAKALSVTRATLINKKRTEKFNASLSERIISLADLYAFGYEVFEDEENFNRWMFQPLMALGGKKPYDLVDNQFGREEVKNIIGRIAYGVYS